MPLVASAAAAVLLTAVVEFSPGIVAFLLCEVSFGWRLVVSIVTAAVLAASALAVQRADVEGADDVSATLADVADMHVTMLAATCAASAALLIIVHVIGAT
jgi:hypothetical protein